jgi:hypothetical protein
MQVHSRRPGAIVLFIAAAPAAGLLACASNSANSPASNTGDGGAGGDGKAGGAGKAPVGGKASGPGGVSSGGVGGVTPPPQLHSCDDLPAIGEWEVVTPPPIAEKLVMGNSVGIVSVAVDPLDPATVYAAGGDQPCCTSGSRGIWKSTDCGGTWQKANTGTLGAELDTGLSWGLMPIDTQDSQIIYAVNGYGQPATLFKSSNGGVDWAHAWGTEISQHLDNNFVSVVALDQNDPKHVVASFHENCKGDVGPMCMAETTDGENWRMFKGPGDGWLEGAGPVVIGPTTFLYAAPFTGLFYTSDSGATWEKVAPDAFYQMHRASDGAMYLGSAQHGILRSTDGYKWDSIPDTPPTTGITGGGGNLYASFQNDSSGHPFWTATEADPYTWKKMESPEVRSGGSILAYDGKHHILYSANYGSGLWRVVTREP